VSDNSKKTIVSDFNYQGINAQLMGIKYLFDEEQEM
jgi:hypothetical protein